MSTNPEAPHRRQWITLCEALSGIAFGEMLTIAALHEQLSGHALAPPLGRSERMTAFSRENDDDRAATGLGSGHFTDRISGTTGIETAWRSLCEKVSEGIVQMRGRHSVAYTLTDARLNDISRIDSDTLSNFSELDMTLGGLRRSADERPMIVWEGHDAGFAREVQALGDDGRLREGYLLIEVRREDLRRCWPSQQCWLRIPQDQIVRWCRNWIESGKGYGMDSAWVAFKADSAHTGLTRDDVFRPAWMDAKRNRD